MQSMVKYPFSIVTRNTPLDLISNIPTLVLTLYLHFTEVSHLTDDAIWNLNQIYLFFYMASFSMLRSLTL